MLLAARKGCTVYYIHITKVLYFPSPTGKRKNEGERLVLILNAHLFHGVFFYQI